MKYNRISSHLDYKLIIFYNIYKRVDLLREVYIRAFPIILKGLAKAHYYNAILSRLSYFNAYNNI